jgi:hypothetical protein
VNWGQGDSTDRRFYGLKSRCTVSGCVVSSRTSLLERIAFLHDALVDIRSFCGYGDARLLRAGSAEPMVHPRLRRSLRARVRLRFSAGSLAVWIGRGSVVCGCDTAVGVGRTRKVNWDWFSSCALAAAKFFEHLGIDVAAADDGNVHLRLR